VNRRTQLFAEAAITQNSNYSAGGSCGRNHRSQEGGYFCRNTQHPIDHTLLIFADPIGNISSNQSQQK
jgi:hypothetical protein